MAGAPEMSPQHFEKLLPYAVALGVEKPWTETFDKWLAAPRSMITSPAGIPAPTMAALQAPSAASRIPWPRPSSRHCLHRHPQARLPAASAAAAPPAAGRRWRGRGLVGHTVSTLSFAARPSSDPSGHLLPDGEKRECAAASRTSSPLRGRSAEQSGGGVRGCLHLTRNKKARRSGVESGGQLIRGYSFYCTVFFGAGAVVPVAFLVGPAAAMSLASRRHRPDARQWPWQRRIGLRELGVNGGDRGGGQRLVRGLLQRGVTSAAVLAFAPPAR